MLTNDVPPVGPSQKLSDLFELCCSTKMYTMKKILIWMKTCMYISLCSWYWNLKSNMNILKRKERTRQWLTWVNSYKSLFRHFSLSVAMARNQNEEFAHNFYAWWRITQQIFLKTFCQNTCNVPAIKANFHFSCWKSMETLSCHSNQRTCATAIKTIFL